MSSSYVVITDETAPGGGIIKHISVVESQPVVGELNKLVYNGIDLRQYGLYVSGDKTFSSPKKEYNKVSIPGRSGDLFFWKERFANVTLKYDAILVEDYEESAAIIRSILLSPNGYVRLEDGYHPDEFRMAIFEGPLDLKSLRLAAGTTTLSFNCMPQRWLKSGETEISVTANQNVTIPNATAFESKPLFKAKANGERTITVDGVDFTVTLDANDFVYIDCETQDCYKIQNGQKISWNQYLTIDEFPVIKPGGSTVKITANSTLSVIPRWYIL